MTGKFEDREYDSHALAIFRANEPNRARLRPDQCDERHAKCWVKLGPPAFRQVKPGSGSYGCAGCGGVPRTVPLQPTKNPGIAAGAEGVSA